MLIVRLTLEADDGKDSLGRRGRLPWRQRRLHDDRAAVTCGACRQELAWVDRAMSETDDDLPDEDGGYDA